MDENELTILIEQLRQRQAERLAAAIAAGRAYDPILKRWIAFRGQGSEVRAQTPGEGADGVPAPLITPPSLPPLHSFGAHS